MIFRPTLRSLKKEPGFVIIAVATLALGIGAASSIFSVIESVLLRPLPYSEPERLVVVWATERDELNGNLSGANLIDIQEQNQSFDGITAVTPLLFTRQGGEEPERLAAVVVTPNFFAVMGATPALGRAFTDETSDASAVILSFEYWDRAFGKDPEALGTKLTLNNRLFDVIGVAPRGFKIPFENADIWTRAPSRIPPPPVDFGLPPDELRGLHWLRAVGRLSPNVSLDEAQADLDVVAKRLEEAYPDDNTGRGLHLVPLYDQIVGDVRPALMILLGAVSMLVLIGCANVANLLLARACGRGREVAIRAALGASRARIVSELLAESIALAILAGGVGLLLSLGLTRLILLWGPSEVFRLEDVALNPAVVGFAIGASVITGLIFGILPALQTSRPDLTTALKDAGRGSSGGGSKRLGRGLVVAEVGIAVVLLVLSGLLIRSFVLLTNVDPGFDPARILTMRLWLPDTTYDNDEKITRAYGDILERLGEIPDVVSASGVLGVPLSGSSANFGISLEGKPEPPPGEELGAGFQAVAPGYFRTMGIPLLRGRDLGENDVATSPKVAVVNRTAAERFWPGEDPMGARFTQDGETWVEVVGISADVLHNGLDQEPRAEIYAPFPQATFPFMTLVLKTRGDAESVRAQASREIRAVDPDLPVYKIMTLRQVVTESVAEPRFNTFVLAIFGLGAIVLAAVGLYALIAENVSQRRREIGIRIALGASTNSVLRLVLRESTLLVLSGLAIGTVVAAGLSRFLSSLLFHVTTTDLPTYGGVSLLLAAVAFVAAIVPALRASRVDPLNTLRYE